MREGAETVRVVLAYLECLRSVSLGPPPLPGVPLPDARKRCALGPKALTTFLIICIKVLSSLNRLVPCYQRAIYVHNVANFRLPNWYVQFLILIVAIVYQDSSNQYQRMRKASQN
jgi:hypothetical protein